MTETEMRDEFFDYQRMWSKRYLQRVRSCVHTIAMIRSEIAEIDINKDGLKAVRYDVDNVGGTPDDDAMARRVERMNSLKAEFQEELQQTQQRLSALQKEKKGGERFILSKEQQDEIVKLRKSQAETRKQLKNVRKELTADIDSLGLRLKVVNIALVPVLVVLFGLLRGFLRRKHA